MASGVSVRRVFVAASVTLVLGLLAAAVGLGPACLPTLSASAQEPGLTIIPDSMTLPAPLGAAADGPDLRAEALGPEWTNLMSEGFEGTVPATGWIHWPPTGDYAWGKRDCEAHGGTYSALGHGGGTLGAGQACGTQYPASMTNVSLIYGPFSLEGATAAELSFWLKLDTVRDADRIYYWASTDANHFFGYWIAGTTAGWEQVTLDLANVPNLGNVLGQSKVWIAFSIYTDAADSGQGAYIDDVMLRARGAGTGARVAYLPAVMGGRPLEQASKVVTTTQSGTVTTSSGVSVTIPAGAVSPTSDGQPGTITFSAEEFVNTAPLPSGFAGLSNAYTFGPSGFNFSAPVKVTFPVPAGKDMDTVGIMLYDEPTAQWKVAPATTDSDKRTVSTETQHFTVFRPVESESYRTQGWFYWSTQRGLDTSVLGTWICVASATLESGASPATVAWPQWSRSVPWATDAPWVENSLPKGTYTFYYRWGGPSPTDAKFAQTAPVTINNSTPTTVNLTVPPSGASITNGYPPCLGAPNNGQPDASAGTGEVQVTLNWTAAVDLDLHVVEPSGEEIYYSHPYSGTNGELDLDNRCSNYVSGRPENIFWPPAGSGGAPTGTYLIKVVWYDNCSESPAEVPFSVRVIVRGRVYTFRKVFSGTPNPNSAMTVATCTKPSASSGETPICW